MVATVAGLDGALAGKLFTVGSRPVTFGRGDENDVVINSLLVSRVHAELRPEAGGYVLQDRGSSNGTWVNGSRVSAQQLHPGDEIVIGGETFRACPARYRDRGRAGWPELCAATGTCDGAARGD